MLTDWGISEHVLNLEENAVRFCTDVLEEIMEIFPGQYVHIGGDECPTTEWEASPRARQLCERLGLAGAQELQGWFTRADVRGRVRQGPAARRMERDRGRRRTAQGR